MEIGFHFRSRSCQSASRSSAAFSVMELIVLIAMMGLLAAVVVNIVGTQPVAVRNIKLASDVATLNHMIAVYVADRGPVTGNPQTVLDKLKRSRPQAEWNQHPSPVTGSLLDMRLRARITTGADRNGQERAFWNIRTQRFEIGTGPGSAVSEFFLDETLATQNPGTESPSGGKPVVKYNSGAGKNQGWVWGSAAVAQAVYQTPGSNQGGGASRPFNPADTRPPPSDDDDGGDDDGGDGDGDGDDDGGAGGPATPGATQLPPPAISPPGGAFAYAAFPTMVLLSPNGAPAAGSVLEYSINGGSWTMYSGSPLTVASADTVNGRNRATDTALYYNSNPASATYYRLVSGFTGTASGTWGNAVGGDTLVSSFENSAATATFRHGDTKEDLGDGQILDSGVENVITFTPTGFNTIVPNVWFGLGNVVMLNGTTFYNSEADSVTLSVNLALTDPANTAAVDITLDLVSTENSSNDLISADVVALRSPVTDFKVTVDGVEYRLELSWATMDAGAGVVQGNQFLVFETASASAVLRARFVPNQ